MDKLADLLISKEAQQAPKCAYCGKPSLCLEECEVWVNGYKVKKMFCDDNCAELHQMGSEG